MTNSQPPTPNAQIPHHTPLGSWEFGNWELIPGLVLVESVQRLEQHGPPLFHRHPTSLPLAPRLVGGRPSTSSRSAGSHASSASRSSPASAGARPSVEIAIVTPSRRTTPPAYADACRGIVHRVHEQLPTLCRREHLPG